MCGLLIYSIFRRDVFECSVLISTWRVRHAWHKALMERCSQTEKRIQMSKQLGQIVSEICTGHGNATLFDDFMDNFIDNSEFVEYFKAVWYPRIGFWISSLQTLPLASQEMSAMIEFYHRQMNVRVLNESDRSVYQRVDWLVNKLTTKVHSYFWLDEFPEKHDFDRYRRDEWLDGLTSWRSSLEIPDSDVIFEGEQAKVIDQQVQDNFFLISNPGSEFALCDCKLSEKGYLCDHVCKVRWVFHRRESSKASLSLYQYKQVLMKILCCTPHDSLIRDYAVSLAASLTTQINPFSESDGDERQISGHLSDVNNRLRNHEARELGFCNVRDVHDGMEIDPVLPSGLLADSCAINENDTLKDGEFSNRVNGVDMVEEPLAIAFPPSIESRDSSSDKGDKNVNFCEDTTPLKFYMRSKPTKKRKKGAP